MGELALLAVVGDDGLNIARLHLEARQSAVRPATSLEIHTLDAGHPLDALRR